MSTARQTADRPLPETLAARVEAASALLQEIADDFSPAALASSLGAEDMVLTDLIVRAGLPIGIFSIDTGRLPAETYDLIARIRKHYGLTLRVYFPRHDLVEAYALEHGVNAFYESVDLRRQCCYLRKVEPLERALGGLKAWITGMRASQSATREGLPLRSVDEAHGGLIKFNPLGEWSESEIWAYLRSRSVPYNALHDRFYPSIGCAPCTRPVTPGEDTRAGRWWWENPELKECGLHVARPRNS
ncbi:phosphoadenylyl-sulfate reductase [Accumulibacter sp.]|uniref:phosphoadenylyl-sulfate reductase n=1 Tax=Accumulibacter sp. TaxID=2053492 RepID=UPI0025E8EC89|nr:phosphoadenylyl-sulfate reductase [Accumulibacter sp.]MCM8594288.1 phosphoadenylyl-sulfate reductase [Accumulibacter sp.]MCM8627889.1 phosphoadenylyl-sulfate reductase [Accumulibacter sp.]MDS4048432.1 phosphoadenylyl-sulfate reductase [Accumulibacter sp.]